MIFYLTLLLLLLLLPCSNKRMGMFLFFILVCGVSAIRYNIGYDYINYLDIILSRNTYAIAYDRLEPLGRFLIDTSRHLEYPQFFFIVSSIIIIIGVAFWIYRESEDYKLSILIFMALPMFFWASLSIVRQFMAISFGLFFFNAIISRKYKQSYAWLLLAILSHSSAFVLAITYFLPQKLTFSRYILIYTSSFILGFVFYGAINWGVGISIFEKAQLFIQKSDLKGFKNQMILFNVFFVLHLLLLKRTKQDSLRWTFYSQLFLIGIFLLNVLNFAPVFAGRVSSFFLISFVILLPNGIMKLRQHKHFYRLLATPVFIFFYIYTLYLASSSYEKGLTVKDPYIPYDTYFDKSQY